MMRPVEFLRTENATPADVEGVMALLRLMHEEAALFPLNEEKVGAQIKACLSGGYIAVIRDDAGEIVASMGVVFQQPWYSDAWHLTETWTFVREDHRRSTCARQLLTSAITGANAAKKPIIVGVFSDERTEGKCRLFRRHMKPIGAIFIHQGH